MVFEVFHSPYSRADHHASLDLAFLIHEDKGANRVLYPNHLAFDLIFQLTYKNRIT